MVAAGDYITTQAARAVSYSQIRSIVKEAIQGEIDYAAEFADSDGGFPDEYKQHLRRVAARIEPDILVDVHGFQVYVDLEDWLGSHDELTRAYHQGAILADGTQLWGPYEGQALKQEDAEERHVYWEALRSGQTSVGARGNRTGSVKLKGSWEETVQRYIEIWGDKAPEWLFIQFGQEEWEPYVPQYDIVNGIEDAVTILMRTYLTNLLDEVVAIANAYESTGLDVGYTGDKGPPRVKSGSVTVGGKTYSPGRFVPKGGLPSG